MIRLLPINNPKQYDHITTKDYSKLTIDIPFRESIDTYVNPTCELIRIGNESHVTLHITNPDTVVVVTGHAVATIYGPCKEVLVRRFATCHVYDGQSVVFKSSSEGTLHGSSHGIAEDNAKVVAYDTSHLETSSERVAVLHDNATGRSDKGSIIEAYDTSHVLSGSIGAAFIGLFATADPGTDTTDVIRWCRENNVYITRDNTFRYQNKEYNIRDSAIIEKLSKEIKYR